MNDKSQSERMLVEGSVVDQAVKQGVRDALWRHVKLGESVVQWRDGRVVEIGPEELRRQLEEHERVERSGGTHRNSQDESSHPEAS